MVIIKKPSAPSQTEWEVRSPMETSVAGFATTRPIFFSPHHSDKQPDTTGDPHPQTQRDIGYHPVADAEDRQQQHAECTPEDSPHPYLPGVTHGADHTESKKGVQPHCRCQCDRQICQTTHQNTAECRNQTGGDEDSLCIHPGSAEDLRVNKNDIHHSKKGGYTGDNFGSCRGTVCL
ncbi:Uncharacterised protein [Morganella morganii]|nr:Uncharacterised protein [Morganella morganii]